MYIHMYTQNIQHPFFPTPRKKSEGEKQKTNDKKLDFVKKYLAWGISLPNKILQSIWVRYLR